MFDLSPQSAPKRTLIQVAVTIREFMKYTLAAEASNYFCSARIIGTSCRRLAS
jgi:hypothetical protein